MGECRWSKESRCSWRVHASFKNFGGEERRRAETSPQGAASTESQSVAGQRKEGADGRRPTWTRAWGGPHSPSRLGVGLEDSLTYFCVVEVAFGAGDNPLPSGLHLPSDVTCGWAHGCRDRDCVSAKAERPASFSLRNASGGGASLPRAGLRWEEPPPPAHQLDPGRPAHPPVGENTPGGAVTGQADCRAHLRCRVREDEPYCSGSR